MKSDIRSRGPASTWRTGCLVVQSTLAICGVNPNQWFAIISFAYKPGLNTLTAERGLLVALLHVRINSLIWGKYDGVDSSTYASLPPATRRTSPRSPRNTHHADLRVLRGGLAQKTTCLGSSGYVLYSGFIIEVLARGSTVARG